MMDAEEFERLRERKARSLCAAASLHRDGRAAEAVRFYREAAADEEALGRELLAREEQGRAAVNLLSAASCRHLVGETPHAVSLLAEIISLPAVPGHLKNLLENYRQQWGDGLR